MPKCAKHQGSSLGGVRSQKGEGRPWGFPKSPYPSLPWRGYRVRIAADGGKFRTWQVLLWPEGHEQQQMANTVCGIQGHAAQTWSGRSINLQLPWLREAVAGPCWGELGCECMTWKRLYPKGFFRGDESEPFPGQSLIPGTILFKSRGNKRRSRALWIQQLGREVWNRETTEGQMADANSEQPLGGILGQGEVGGTLRKQGSLKKPG